jgi:surface antigen
VSTPPNPALPWLAMAEAAPSLREAVAALRTALPGMRVSAMDALDLRDEKPAARGERRALYLAMSGDGHCWTLTTDAQAAGAVFVVDTPTAAR